MSSIDKLRHDGKVILVVGGASGMGKAAVELLRDRGATVVCADRSPGSDDVEVDISDVAQVDAIVADVISQHGRLDGAANFAAIPAEREDVAEISDEAYRAQVAVNLDGMFYLTRAQIRAMVPNGRGAIVNVSSLAGVTGLRGMSAYSAVKHGVIGLTRSVALEYAERGIRVNAVCPGRIRTPMLLGVGSKDEAAMARMLVDQPMGRLGEPEEVAEGALFLLSDAASFITGELLQVDGGCAAR